MTRVGVSPVAFKRAEDQWHKLPDEARVAVWRWFTGRGIRRPYVTLVIGSQGILLSGVNVRRD